MYRSRLSENWVSLNNTSAGLWNATTDCWHYSDRPGDSWCHPPLWAREDPKPDNNQTICKTLQLPNKSLWGKVELLTCHSRRCRGLEQGWWRAARRGSACSWSLLSCGRWWTCRQITRHEAAKPREHLWRSPVKTIPAKNQKMIKKIRSLIHPSSEEQRFEIKKAFF